MGGNPEEQVSVRSGGKQGKDHVYRLLQKGFTDHVVFAMETRKAVGTLRKIGFERLLSQGGRQPKLEVALCIAMIVARLIEPASKLATATFAWRRLDHARRAVFNCGRTTAAAGSRTGRRHRGSSVSPRGRQS
jgi:hypothetical protein